MSRDPLSSSSRAEAPLTSSSETEYAGYTGIPWSELYRFQRFDDLLGDVKVVNKFKEWANRKNPSGGSSSLPPNLLLVGPPGTGKTNVIKCLCKTLLLRSSASSISSISKVDNNDQVASGVWSSGKSTTDDEEERERLYKAAVLELNASDLRGVDIIRGPVQHFATKCMPEVPMRFILFDEAEHVLPNAQKSLATLMETCVSQNKKVCFMLACNDSSKIVDRLQSLCTIVRFPCLTNGDIQTRLRQVVSTQQSKENRGSCCSSTAASFVTQPAFDAICLVAEGDMRRALNCLQAVWTRARLVGATEITSDDVFAIGDQPHPALLADIVRHCCACAAPTNVVEDGGPTTATTAAADASVVQDGNVGGDLIQAIVKLNLLWAQGFQSGDVLDAICKVLKQATFFPNEALRAEFLKHFVMLMQRQNDARIDNEVSLVQMYWLLGQWYSCAKAAAVNPRCPSRAFTS